MLHSVQKYALATTLLSDGGTMSAVTVHIT
jgi:hypothetical protein